MNIFRQLYMNHNCKIVNSDNSQIMPIPDVLTGYVIDSTPVKEKRVRLDLQTYIPLLQAMQAQYNDMIALADLYTDESGSINAKDEKALRLRLKSTRLYTQAEKLQIEIQKIEGRYK